MTMELNMSVIWSHFNGDLAGLAEHILNRIDAEDLKADAYEALWQAMDDELIYTSDRWTLLQGYCTPEDANFNYAWEEFQNDLMTCINDGVFKKGEEEA